MRKAPLENKNSTKEERDFKRNNLKEMIKHATPVRERMIWIILSWLLIVSLVERLSFSLISEEFHFNKSLFMMLEYWIELLFSSVPIQFQKILDFFEK